MYLKRVYCSILQLMCINPLHNALQVTYAPPPPPATMRRLLDLPLELLQ